MRRGGLPPGAESGYVYDWLRQRQRKTEEERRRQKKLKKKIKRSSKRKKKDRQGELEKIEKTIGNVKRHLGEEKRKLRGVK